jgi:hypothetical protein
VGISAKYHFDDSISSKGKIVKISGLAVIAGLCILSSSAMAEVYVGVGGGLAHSNAATKMEKAYYSDSTDQKDSNNAGFIVYGGYSFNQYLSVEADYIDFGKYKWDSVYNGYSNEMSVKGKGVSLAAVGTWPLTESFGVIGKLGLGEMKQTFHYCESCGISDTNYSSMIVVGGLGAYWNAMQNLRIRASYEHFGGGHFKAVDAYGFEEKKSADFGLLYAGAELRF